MGEINLKSCAYIGDAVWELFVRKYTVTLTQNAKELHKMTTDRVKAIFQAELLEKIENELSEDELELMRRGRNLSIPVARKSEQKEYRKATAFEVLMGYWYDHDKQRLEEILKKIKEFL